MVGTESRIHGATGTDWNKAHEPRIVMVCAEELRMSAGSIPARTTAYSVEWPRRKSCYRVQLFNYSYLRPKRRGGWGENPQMRKLIFGIKAVHR